MELRGLIFCIQVLLTNSGCSLHILRSGTVIHLDIKHASLPRSTAVHNMIPEKSNQPSIPSRMGGKPQRKHTKKIPGRQKLFL
ncbi:hypothetical protein SLE2022_117970 [Rubroshorea leprosula]